MNKKNKISLLSLIATCALSTSVAVATLPAYAEDDARLVTINGNSIFQTLSNAEVSVYENAEEEGYPLFVLNDSDDTVVYRKNLAYSWYQDGKKDNLNLSFGFKSLNFDNAFVKFQSQQNQETKDGVSDNFVVFVTANDNSGVYVYTTTDDEDLKRSAEDLADDNAQFITAQNATKIDLAFGEKIDGDYAVTISGVDYTFENIGGSYAAYVSASKTHPATPLTFGTSVTEDNSAEIILYELNNQSFRFIESSIEDFESGAYSKGQIRDDQAPVVVFHNSVNFIKYGNELNVKPIAIDVLSSSPTVKAHYFILSQEQVAKGSEFDADDVEDKNLYSEIRDKDEVFFLEYEDCYYPTENDIPQALKNDFEAKLLAKVYYEVSDVSTTNKQTDNVLLDWYVENTVDVNGNKYVCVGKDTAGVKFKVGADLETAIDKYQAKLDALTQDENKQPSLTAGSTEWLYLPSVEDLFDLNGIDEYEDLKFSIYYNSDAKNTRTSLNYNELSINVKKDGYYTFTVYATDANGNTMYYLDKDGEVKEIDTTEIWNFFEDDELDGIVPWFNFSVGYKDASVKTPGSQTTGYIGTRYNAKSFEINGVSGKYTETYTLTLFDREKYTKEVGEISYNEFIENISTIYVEHRDCFKIIPAASTIEEEDDNYDLYMQYAWNTSSLSFVPQEEGNNSFYVIRLQVEDTINNNTIVEYMAISVSAKPSALRGDSEWLQNNLASIVLFGIAGVSFIGIVVLFIVGPKKPHDLDLVEDKKENDKE